MGAQKYDHNSSQKKLAFFKTQFSSGKTEQELRKQTQQRQQRNSLIEEGMD
jgi:hypothetical protein